MSPRPVDWSQRPLRALLFAPGSEPGKLAKVASFGADAVVFDLEDAVAEPEKDAARELVREALMRYQGDSVAMARVNSADTGRMENDVCALVCEQLDCIVVPKVELPETLFELDLLLTRLERERRIHEGRVRLLPLVESARGLVRAEEIALSAPGRLLTLAFGSVDFTADIGVSPTEGGAELLYARSRLIVAARAGDLGPPVDGPYLDLQNVEGLVADSRRSRGGGFQGRVVVYPPHVGHVQDAYGALPHENLESARTIVEAFEEALRSGLASIQVEGRFVDYPIYFAAKRTLELHKAKPA
jgi:citrate lyase subunit beta/citryl-CoA lyase